MQLMERQIVTVNAEGQLVFPTALQSALQPGSRWEVSFEDNHLVLQPMLPEALAALRGMFAGKPSLEDDLMEWRRQEKDNARW